MKEGKMTNGHSGTLEGYTLPATPGEIGTAIKWDVDAAAEFAFQLLEDVNHHKLAKLLLIGMNFSDEELALVLRYLDKPAKPEPEPDREVDLCDCDDHQNCLYMHDPFD